MKKISREISQRLTKILVVEDEIIIATNLKEQLETFGYCVGAIATSGEKAVDMATALCPDLVLMDIHLQGDMDGIEAAQLIWERLSIPVIYVTGHSDPSTLERVKVSCPFGYILKPIKERELFIAIDIALHRYAREQLLTAILREMGDGVIFIDDQCRIRFLNGVAQTLTGWQFSEAIEQELTEVFQVVDAQERQSVNLPIDLAIQNKFTAAIPSHSVLISRQNRMIPIGGSVTPIRDKTDNLIGTVFVFQDISSSTQLEKAKGDLEQTLTALKTTQFQLIQSEKLSSVGRMATALIQEFNNPITWICGNIVLGRSYFRDMLNLLQLYQQAYPEPTPDIQQLRERIDLEFIAQDWQKMFNSIQMGAERLMDVTLSLQALRNFSTLDELDQKSFDINETIDSTLFLMQHRLKSQGKKAEIQVIKNYSQLPFFRGYASQLHQVLIHLLNNAIDAIEVKDVPGIIRIETNVIHHQVSFPSVGEFVGEFVGESVGKSVGKSVGAKHSRPDVSEFYPNLNANASPNPTSNDADVSNFYPNLNANASPNPTSNDADGSNFYPNPNANASPNPTSNDADVSEFYPNPNANASPNPTSNIKNSSIPNPPTQDVVIIRITDNGCGMSEEVQRQLFDPFFTTKPVGTAVGLGLSVSYKIVVEKHGGKIRCHSVEGEGTTFEIELPVISY
ncbi:MAG: ATP-binding protein [Coleofasciculus sp. G3-WIS-01]|uniref:ATP-binding protein n=1 Tax=Coleofasciculus sp. G3-WIS-01 TaxID=3069528 RepID=UPI003302BBA5